MYSSTTDYLVPPGSGIAAPRWGLCINIADGRRGRPSSLFSEEEPAGVAGVVLVVFLIQRQAGSIVDRSE